MIKIVNGLPERLVEMDDQVTITKQMGEDAGPIIQINKFNVNPDEVDQFLEAFAATAEVLKQKLGNISAQLHRGIAGSCVFLNYEVWESVEHFRRAVSSPEFQSSIVGLPPSTVMSHHLFKKIAVSGICVGQYYGIMYESPGNSDLDGGHGGVESPAEYIMSYAEGV